MSRLEEKIKQQKKEFDYREPDKEHLARFILKLEKDQENYHRRNTPWYYTRAAAAILILFAASYFLIDILVNNNSEKQVTQISYNDELTEVMNYYDQLSEAKFNEIEGKTPDTGEAAKFKQMAYGKMEDIDSKLAAIEKEYMKNPDNEMLKAALIQNRKKKAEVMQNILLKIDFANSQLY
ncbi:MAG: hypothetical protein P8100_02905 [bacterium]